MRPVRRAARRARRADDGQATVELVGYLPFIMLLFVVFLGVFAYFMTMEDVNRAARAGARVESQGGNGYRAAHQALPERLQDNARIRVTSYGGDAHATVSATVPPLERFHFIDWSVTRDVTMPLG